VPFNGSALVNPSENSTAWIIKSWSSFGSGCR
jgi:hypothetical protein